MRTDILNVNGFSILIDVNPIVPPLAGGSRFEAKVKEIYDQTTKQEVGLNSDNSCLVWGKVDSEAYEKARDLAKRWAEQQR